MRLHYNDLQVLLMGLDIAKLRQVSEAEKAQARRIRGITDERELTAAEAVKFLKGSKS